MRTSLSALTHAAGRPFRRLLGRRRPPPPPPDPFEALHVQMRLHVIADEIRLLQHDQTAYARAARLEARTAAYDALLRSACDMAGVIDLGQLDKVTGHEARAERELQLAERGWSW